MESIKIIYLKNAIDKICKLASNQKIFIQEIVWKWNTNWKLSTVAVCQEQFVNHLNVDWYLNSTWIHLKKMNFILAMNT